MQEVSGSIPLGSTNTLDQQTRHNVQVGPQRKSALGICCLPTVFRTSKMGLPRSRGSDPSARMEPQLIIRTTGRALHFFRVSSDGAFFGWRILNVHQIRGGSSTISAPSVSATFLGFATLGVSASTMSCAVISTASSITRAQLSAVIHSVI